MATASEELSSPVATTWWQRLSQTSPLHGLSFIGSAAQSNKEVLFWCFLLLICLCFSVRDTIVLINAYRSQATVISASMQLDDALDLSGLGVCLQLNPWWLSRSVDATFNETSLNESLSSIATMMRDDDSGGNERFDLSTLDPTKAESDFLMKTAHIYLSQIVEYDLGGRLQKYFISNNTERAIELVSGFFSKRKYSLSTLVDYVARYLCKQVSYGFDAKGNFTLGGPIFAILLTDYGYKPLEMCNLADVSWLGPTVTQRRSDAICFNWNTTKLPKLFDDLEDLLGVQTYGMFALSETPFFSANESTLNAQNNWYSPIVDLRAPASLLDPRKRDGQIELVGDGAHQLLFYVHILSKFRRLNRGVARSYYVINNQA